jgi:hypothetical protein
MIAVMKLMAAEFMRIEAIGFSRSEVKRGGRRKARSLLITGEVGK